MIYMKLTVKFCYMNSDVNDFLTNSVIINGRPDLTPQILPTYFKRWFFWTNVTWTSLKKWICKQGRGEIRIRETASIHIVYWLVQNYAKHQSTSHLGSTNFQLTKQKPRHMFEMRAHWPDQIYWKVGKELTVQRIRLFVRVYQHFFHQLQSNR